MQPLEKTSANKNSDAHTTLRRMRYLLTRAQTKGQIPAQAGK
jgi:hypothetical protein